MKLNHIRLSRSRHLATWPVAGLLATLSACGGGGGGDAPASPTSAAATQDVSVQFAASVVDKVVTCGSTLSNLGSSVVNARLRDLRFYLSNVRLVSSSGAEVPITLTQNDNQNGAGANSAVLIDLSNQQAGTVCEQATDGSAATYTAIVGKVPPGTYVGLRATVGLPAALNHSDTMADDTPVPLQNMAMGWSWQNGRKFIKLELDPVGGVTNAVDSSNVSTYNVHIASTDCSGGNVASATCAKANMVSIDIALNPGTQQVALDLNEVFRGVNLSGNATGAVGCMSASDDADCGTLFARLGLNLSTGALSGAQAVFRAIPK
jgi:uncharacterized repeat protein (TIGR04052 family)